jgi:hypothetical protein
MSPENQGVFQFIKNETQQAITSEDWTTDGSVVMHQIKHHLCPLDRKVMYNGSGCNCLLSNKDRLDVTRSH